MRDIPACIFLGKVSDIIANHVAHVAVRTSDSEQRACSVLSDCDFNAAGQRQTDIPTVAMLEYEFPR